MRKLRYEEFLSPEDEHEDVDDVGEDDEDLVTNKTSPPPGILVLNKVDLMDRSKRAEQLPELVQSLATDPKKTFSKAFPVSALHSVGTEALFNHLLTLAKYRPWDYSPSESTAMNDRSRAIEVVRESVYDQVHKEICYGIEIVHKSWEDFRDGSVRIEHDLFVKSGGNRKIVVGKDGRTIGQIGVKARHVLEALLGRRVHLLLNVRVRRTNARHSQQFLSELY
jgi:GTP-binding protein Era